MKTLLKFLAILLVACIDTKVTYNSKFDGLHCNHYKMDPDGHYRYRLVGRNFKCGNCWLLFHKGDELYFTKEGYDCDRLANGDVNVYIMGGYVCYVSSDAQKFFLLANQYGTVKSYYTTLRSKPCIISLDGTNVSILTYMEADSICMDSALFYSNKIHSVSFKSY
jgi:hypothetical protein